MAAWRERSAAKNKTRRANSRCPGRCLEPRRGMGDDNATDAFIAQWRDTGGSELANTQSFINGLCALIGVAPPDGSRSDDAHNDYVFERRVFQAPRQSATDRARARYP